MTDITKTVIIASRDKYVADVVISDIKELGLMQRLNCVTVRYEWDLLDSIHAHNPFLVFLDTSFSGSATTRLMRRIYERSKCLNVVGFGTHRYAPRFVARFISNGASLGYLNWRGGPEVFRSGIASVFQDKPSMPDNVRRILKRYKQVPVSPAHNECGLSDREIDVVMLIAEGKSPSQIADALRIAVKTVHNIVSSIYIKWNVVNLVQIVRHAIYCGLIHKDDFCDEERYQSEIFFNTRGKTYVAAM